MLNFSPIMLFQYAQNSTNYALNYAPNLPILLKLCPLFLEGANLYVQIIALLCCVQHHNFITNLKPGLGAYWEIYTSRLHELYPGHHVKTLSPGLAQSMHGTRYLGTQGLDTVWGLPVYLGHLSLCSKSTYYSCIMLNVFWYPKSMPA